MEIFAQNLHRICLKGSHSAPNLPEETKKTQVDFFKTSSRPSKRPREDLENAPRIIINSPSKNGMNNQSQEQQIIISGNYNKKAEYLALKLDRLRDKAGRYESQKSFLEKCIAENVIPNGLKLELQPTIGNHDEEFLSCWYNKLQSFSKEFMKDIISFCIKTSSELTDDINKTENELTTLLEKKTYEEVKQTIDKNQNIRDRSLRQRKQKKFNQLKFKPKQLQQFKVTEKENAPTESIDSKTQRERSYAAAVKKSNSKTNLYLRRTLSKTSTQDKTQRSIVQQLDIQNNENTFHNRNTLKTAKETTSERDDIKYKEMQEQIKILTSEVTKLKHRDSNKEQQNPPKNYQETEPEAIPSPPPTSSPRKYRILPRNDTIFYSQNSKNLQDASAENRGVTKSELKEVIHLIQNTMLTLTAFEKRFSEQ